MRVFMKPKSLFVDYLESFDARTFRRLFTLSGSGNLQQRNNVILEFYTYFETVDEMLLLPVGLVINRVQSLEVLKSNIYPIHYPAREE
jgi:hypothetical protein